MGWQLACARSKKPLREVHEVHSAFRFIWLGRELVIFPYVHDVHEVHDSPMKIFQRAQRAPRSPESFFAAIYKAFDESQRSPQRAPRAPFNDLPG